MNKKPVLNKSLFDFGSKFLIVAISLITGLASLWLFWHFWQISGDMVLARTVAFTSLGLVSLFYVFSIRSLQVNIFRSGLLRNKYLNGAIVVGIGAQLVAVYLPFFNQILHTAPLGWYEWQYILVVFVSVLIFVELIKMFFTKSIFRAKVN